MISIKVFLKYNISRWVSWSWFLWNLYNCRLPFEKLFWPGVNSWSGFFLKPHCDVNVCIRGHALHILNIMYYTLLLEVSVVQVVFNVGSHKKAMSVGMLSQPGGLTQFHNFDWILTATQRKIFNARQILQGTNVTKPKAQLVKYVQFCTAPTLVPFWGLWIFWSPFFQSLHFLHFRPKNVSKVSAATI